MTQPTILLADDDKEFLNVLTRRCESLGLEVVAVEDALTALSTADFFPPSLACFDVNMPSGNGLAACEMMKDDERLASVPVVILTGKKDEETVRRCHELGAYYIVKSSTVWDDLRSLIGELLNVEPPQSESQPPADATEAFVAGTTPSQRVQGGMLPVAPGKAGDFVDRFLHDVPSEPQRADESSPATPWVLCIDDDADFAHSLRLRLEAHGITVINAFAGTEGYRQAFTQPADAVILDYQMPNGQGDYCLRRLKENPLTKDIPVIVLTGKKDRAIERQMLNLGATCFFHKPIEFAQLLRELQRHVGSRQLSGDPLSVS